MTQNTPPNKCPKCGSVCQEIPASISKKTGKPYQRFLACSNRDCDWTMNMGLSGRPLEQTIQTDGKESERLNDIDSKLQQIWTAIININEKLK